MDTDNLNTDMFADVRKRRRVVRMFQPQFHEKVRSGEKRQTVRKLPKRFFEAGDLLDARGWSGLPYRSPQFKLLEADILEVKAVTILFDRLEVFMNGESLSQYAANRFAKADGFVNLLHMREWFLLNHGKKLTRFDGILIKW